MKAMLFFTKLENINSGRSIIICVNVLHLIVIFIFIFRVIFYVIVYIGPRYLRLKWINIKKFIAMQIVKTVHNNKEQTKKCIHLTSTSITKIIIIIIIITIISLTSKYNYANTKKCINNKSLHRQEPYSSLLKENFKEYINSICNLVGKKKKTNKWNKKKILL